MTVFVRPSFVDDALLISVYHCIGRKFDHGGAWSGMVHIEGSRGRIHSAVGERNLGVMISSSAGTSTLFVDAPAIIGAIFGGLFRSSNSAGIPTNDGRIRSSLN
jgi:hypothetical protein